MTKHAPNEELYLPGTREDAATRPDQRNGNNFGSGDEIAEVGAPTDKAPAAQAPVATVPAATAPIATAPRPTQGAPYRTVIGVFADSADATAAFNALQQAGFAEDNLSVVARDPETAGGAASAHPATGETAVPVDRVAGGTVAGGILGAAAGLLVGIGVSAIPGVGPIIGAGVIASTFLGAGIGAATGGLVGTLVDAGVPEETARTYEEGVRGGSVLLSARATDDAQTQQAQDLFAHYRGQDVRVFGDDTRAG